MNLLFFFLCGLIHICCFITLLRQQVDVWDYFKINYSAYVCLNGGICYPVQQRDSFVFSRALWHMGISYIRLWPINALLIFFNRICGQEQK